MILIEKVPPAGPLSQGAIYKRSQLHSRFGGNRNAGIVPSSKEPVILLFQGTSTPCGDVTLVYRGCRNGEVRPAHDIAGANLRRPLQKRNGLRAEMFTALGVCACTVAAQTARSNNED